MKMDNNLPVKQILILNATNYEDYPLGGALGTIRLFLKNTGFNPVLVGITNDLDYQLGQWREVDVLGRKLPFLAVANTRLKFIPHKILLLIGILIFHSKIKNKINSFTVNVMLFVNREAYFPAKIIFRSAKRLNLYFKMTEAGNPLEISERKIGRVWFLQRIYLQLFLIPMLKAAKVIFSINDDCRNFCEKHIPAEDQSKIKDVHHYIDQKKLTQYLARAEKEKDREVDRIIFWGRVADVKGLDLIIHAVQHLKQEGRAIEFIVIGDGSEKVDLKKMTVQMKLQKEIVFLGRCTIEEIAGYAKNSDIFVMASYTEGIPTSMLEAMTFGLPIVSTAVGGIPTLVQNSVNGQLVSKRDHILYANGIKMALEMNKKNVIAYNTAFIEQGYSVRSVVQQMDNLMLATQ
jgi:glycosyltransferase involved in cell wall biosynthesis